MLDSDEVVDLQLSRLRPISASLQTSTVQVSDRTIGDAMIFTKKSEGKNSLPGHPQKSKHPLRPAKKPTPDGILEIDLNATRETTLTFVEDYSIEHSSSGASADSICISVNSYSAAAPTGASSSQE